MFSANSQQWFGFARIRHPLEINNNVSGSQDYELRHSQYIISYGSGSQDYVALKPRAMVRARKTTIFTTINRLAGSQDYDILRK